MKKNILFLLCFIIISCSKTVLLERQEIVYQYIEKDKNYKVEIDLILLNKDLSKSDLSQFYVLKEKDTLFFDKIKILEKDTIELSLEYPNREKVFGNKYFIDKIKSIEIKNKNREISINKLENYNTKVRVYMWKAGAFGGIE